MPASRRGGQTRARTAPYAKTKRDAGGSSKPVSGLFGTGLAAECFTSPPLLARQGAASTSPPPPSHCDADQAPPPCTGSLRSNVVAVVAVFSLPPSPLRARRPARSPPREVHRNTSCRRGAPGGASRHRPLQEHGVGAAQEAVQAAVVLDRHPAGLFYGGLPHAQPFSGRKPSCCSIAQL